MIRRRATRSSSARACGDVALARRLLGAALLLDVAEGGHRAQAVGQLERRRRVVTRTIEPSLRTSQSSASCSVSPALRAWTSGQSSSGYGARRGTCSGPCRGRACPQARRARRSRAPPARPGWRSGSGPWVGDPHRLADRGEDRLALAQRLLGLALLLDVLEGDDHPRPVGHVERRRRVGDREHRAVAADEPVLVHLDRLAGPADLRHRAVLGRVGRAVAVLVVDRVVAEAAAQLGQLVVAERREARRVDVDHEAVVIDDPDRLGDGGEDRLHRGELARRLGVGSWQRLGRREPIVPSCRR